MTIADASEFTGFIGHVLRDDAAAVYVNGVEAFRDSTLPQNAAAGVFSSATSGENEIATFLIDPALFVDGPNIIAVQVHQAAANSSDLSFDLRLVGLSTPIPEPTTGVLAFTTVLTLPLMRLKSWVRNVATSSRPRTCFDRNFVR